MSTIHRHNQSGEYIISTHDWNASFLKSWFNLRRKVFFLDLLAALDTRTIAFLVACAFFIQSSAIGAQVILVKEYRGIVFALAGNLCLSVGFALTVLQGSIPDLFTIVIGNTFILVGPILFYIAICRFTGQNQYLGFILVVLIFAIASLLFFRYVNDNLAYRIVVVSVSGSISTGAVVAALLRAKSSSYRLGLILTLIPFAIYGLFLFASGLSTLLSPPTALFARSPIESSSYLLLFFISFLWSIGFILMVSQRLQADLARMATIDFLTRIPNRRATQDFLEKVYARIDRIGGIFSIILIDIDNFKEINDRLGHAAGDLALVRAASFLQTNIRKPDLVGRWGGEEFLIVLSDTSAQDAVHLADRIRRKFSDTRIVINDQSVATTISLGISSSEESKTLDGILKSADDALYKAKSQKNSVALAESGNPVRPEN